MALPKLKTAGQITAKPSGGPPTARASDFYVQLRAIDLRRIGTTTCVCVWRKKQDPATSGLHLTRDAARALRNSILDAATAEGPSVDVQNHRFKVPSLWERFSDADAIMLADELSRATAV